jgi:hypothetical protein
MQSGKSRPIFSCNLIASPQRLPKQVYAVFIHHHLMSRRNFRDRLNLLPFLERLDRVLIFPSAPDPGRPAAHPTGWGSQHRTQRPDQSGCATLAWRWRRRARMYCLQASQHRVRWRDNTRCFLLQIQLANGIWMAEMAEQRIPPPLLSLDIIDQSVPCSAPCSVHAAGSGFSS